MIEKYIIPGENFDKDIENHVILLSNKQELNNANFKQHYNLFIFKFSLLKSENFIKMVKDDVFEFVLKITLLTYKNKDYLGIYRIADFLETNKLKDDFLSIFSKELGPVIDFFQNDRGFKPYNEQGMLWHMPNNIIEISYIKESKNVMIPALLYFYVNTDIDLENPIPAFKKEDLLQYFDYFKKLGFKSNLDWKNILSDGKYKSRFESFNSEKDVPLKNANAFLVDMKYFKENEEQPKLDNISIYLRTLPAFQIYENLYMKIVKVVDFELKQLSVANLYEVLVLSLPNLSSKEIELKKYIEKKYYLHEMIFLKKV